MSLSSKTIVQLYQEHAGKVTDKWSRYLSEYDSLLAPYRNQPVRLLEIGVQNGGSLEIWSKFFEHGVKFIGCDIDPACAALKFNDPRIELIIGDANLNATEEMILASSSDFDIIIDDGSHRSGDIVRSFLKYFPVLKDNGLYVVEDIHASYWQEYEGGLFSPFSSISFFKRLVDVINHDHWGINRSPSDLLAGFSHQYEVTSNEEILQHIHSVEFINSLCIIRKSSPPENSLGTRIMAGTQAEADPALEEKNEQFKMPLPQDSNPWSQRLRPPDEEAEEKEHAINTLSTQLTEIRSENARLTEEVLGYALSRSWRFTRPLRFLQRKWQALRRR
jgi:SAM-dependent methyltransferase